MIDFQRKIFQLACLVARVATKKKPAEQRPRLFQCLIISWEIEILQIFKLGLHISSILYPCSETWPASKRRVQRFCFNIACTTGERELDLRDQRANFISISLCYLFCFVSRKEKVMDWILPLTKEKRGAALAALYNIYQIIYNQKSKLGNLSKTT